MKNVSKISDYYSSRGYDDITDYEELIWRREQELNEQQELNDLNDNNGKFTNENRLHGRSGKANKNADRS